MQIVEDIKPVTYLKSRAADVLKHINEDDYNSKWRSKSRYTRPKKL